MLILVQLDQPDLFISVSCPREVARARYVARKRADDSEDLFEQRYSDYENRDAKVVGMYQETICEVSYLLVRF